MNWQHRGMTPQTKSNHLVTTFWGQVAITFVQQGPIAKLNWAAKVAFSRGPACNAEENWVSKGGWAVIDKRQGASEVVWHAKV